MRPSSTCVKWFAYLLCLFHLNNCGVPPTYNITDCPSLTVTFITVAFLTYLLLQTAKYEEDKNGRKAMHNAAAYMGRVISAMTQWDSSIVRVWVLCIVT